MLARQRRQREDAERADRHGTVTFDSFTPTHPGVGALASASRDRPAGGALPAVLGQSDANLVLYDAGSHSVVRVPSAAAVLVLDTEATACSPD